MEIGFTLRGARLAARASGALWWQAEGLLVVADLHLGRSERLARRGGALLPPYETAATLDRLAGEIAALAPARVLCLGDSFDDAGCPAALPGAERERLTVMMAGRDWVWAAGNHDPGPLDLGGRFLAEARIGPLVFRHECAGEPGEVAGHHHPKARLALRGRSLVRRCFLHGAGRLILPAFGAYAGGLWADHPALAALTGEDAVAILTGTPMVAVPAARGRRRAAG